MPSDEDPMVQNRSMLKDFLATLVTMTGDLSNITAPPFVLDKRSVIEIPSFWAENPSIFVSPANSDDPVQRTLLVLRSFLSGLKSQCYMGHSPEEGVKKPLNAFLGELFVGKWEDQNGTTHMISEQVSHHPPVTACRVWNDKYGVIAEGYNRQTVTFSGSVNVECSGHILKSITKYDEHYLMPIPGFKVKGILSTPYPETSGTYYIPSTNGYTSVVHFEGKSMFSSSSKKHSFKAHLFKEDEGESNPLFTIEGHWDTQFTIHDNRKGEDIEVFDVEKQALKDVPTLQIDPVEEQDPWESRNAWKDTVAALQRGDMKGVNDAKGHLEEGQREMRKYEEEQGKTWETLFFKRSSNDKIVEQLTNKVPNEDFQSNKDETIGVWKFDAEAWKNVRKPYHGSLRPDNTAGDTESKTSAGRRETKPETVTQTQQGQVDQKDREMDRTTGAVEDGRSTNVNRTPVVVGQESEAHHNSGITNNQPVPQTAQTDVGHEHRGSGVPGMSVDEKDQIENMLREQYSTATKERKTSRAKRRSIDQGS